MIKLCNVSKRFRGASQAVVKNVSFTVDRGEILVLLGSSGSGKTTTLKMINRLIEPTSGTIELGGQNIKHINPVELRRSIGYVFQGIGLFPHMTVKENIGIVLRLRHKPQAVRERRALELMRLVNLDPSRYAERYPIELSGGQRQRVGVARALATESKYLLMDEPFGALDAITRDELQIELLRLNRELHKTIIFVTHDLSEAMQLGDRIAIMHRGEIQQIGTKNEVLASPATNFVRDLFAKRNDKLQQLIEQTNE